MDIVDVVVITVTAIMIITNATCDVRSQFSSPRFFSSWKRLLLMTSDQEHQAKRALNSTPHTLVSYLPVFLFKMYNDSAPGPRHVLARRLLEVRLLRLQTWRGDQLTTIILASTSLYV